MYFNHRRNVLGTTEKPVQLLTSSAERAGDYGETSTTTNFIGGFGTYN